MCSNLWTYSTYLVDMFPLKEEELELWPFVTKEDFSIDKTELAFCALEADHVIEHENWAIKLIGGKHDYYLHKSFWMIFLGSSWN